MSTTTITTVLKSLPADSPIRKLVIDMEQKLKEKYDLIATLEEKVAEYDIERESTNAVHTDLKTAIKSMGKKVIIAELNQYMEVQSTTIKAMETQMARLNQKVIDLTHEDNMAHIEKVMGITPNQTTFPNNTTTHSVEVPNATTSSTSRITDKSMPAIADKKFVGRMARVVTKLEIKYATPVEKRVGSYFMRLN